MSTDDAIAKVRARVVAWNDVTMKRAAWKAAEPTPVSSMASEHNTKRVP